MAADTCARRAPQVLKRGTERFEAAWREPGVQVVKLASVPEAAGLAPLLPRAAARLTEGSLAVHYELLRFEDARGGAGGSGAGAGDGDGGAATGAGAAGAGAAEAEPGLPYRVTIVSQPPLFCHCAHIELLLVRAFRARCCHFPC